MRPVEGSLPKMAVYTAIFGSYDELKPQPTTPGTDFYCFTDDPDLEMKPWKVRLAKRHHHNPRLAAKWYKMFPHRALPSYRYTLYIDGSIQLSSQESVLILFSYIGASGLALLRHPDRNNVYDEANFSAQMPKYEGLPLREQVESYRRMGLPPGHGLYAGGILVRDRDVGKNRRFGRCWWRENLRWTYQDQLSLPYVLWRLGVRPHVMPHNLWSNPIVLHDISTRQFENR
jgi:hypothetical protein